MAVDDEGRRPSHAVLAAACDVRADSVEMAMGVEGLGKACSVESQASRIVHEVVVCQFPLVGKQHVIHWPKLALGGSRFSRLGGLEGMRVFVERKMPEHKTQVRTELPLQGLHGLDCLLGIRALEVAVFYERDGSRRFSMHMIALSDDQLRLMRAS